MVDGANLPHPPDLKRIILSIVSLASCQNCWCFHQCHSCHKILCSLPPKTRIPFPCCFGCCLGVSVQSKVTILLLNVPVSSPVILPRSKLAYSYFPETRFSLSSRKVNLPKGVCHSPLILDLHARLLSGVASGSVRYCNPNMVVKTTQHTPQSKNNQDQETCFCQGVFSSFEKYFKRPCSEVVVSSVSKISVSGEDGSSSSGGNGCDRLLLLDQSFCIVRANILMPISSSTSITLLHDDKTHAY